MPDLLVLGGSLGARVFSDVVPAALALLPAAVAGAACRSCSNAARRTSTACAPPMPQAGIAAELVGVLPRRRRRGWRAAHLVIARAGASTVAELAVAGRPAILVPLPGAIDDHQSRQCARAGRTRAAPR